MSKIVRLQNREGGVVDCLQQALDWTKNNPHCECVIMITRPAAKQPVTIFSDKAFTLEMLGALEVMKHTLSHMMVIKEKDETA